MAGKYVTSDDYAKGVYHSKIDPFVKYENSLFYL